MSRRPLHGAPLRGHGDPWLYALVRAICRLVIAPVYRYAARGGDALPRSGGVILAVSHKSWWDPLFAGMALSRPVRPMAKIELFGPRLSRAVVTALGAFPVRRGELDLDAVRQSLAIVGEGGVLLMFPEGTRYHDDEIHPFHPGVTMIGLRSGAPIVPIAIRGSREMARHKLPRFPRVRVAVGEPVDLSGVTGHGNERYATAAEIVRQRVAELYAEL